MKSKEIRQKFLDFFAKKDHEIVSSAPIVLKNDPTLMFTNAGMNQFKDYFLGNKKAANPRVADTQKCLRVSGKHNDLEEVGVDTYHHTMFEMLGNWSFGNYFKKEAIAWAWELLTEVYKIPKEDIYVSVFEGDKEDGLGKDQEAYDLWKAYVPEDRILEFSKKDNFWEMGDTGPCGPCSEIHVDVRSDEEKTKVKGQDLVNMDHPEVIEIWNLVFIQYQRKADKSLELLPEKHVDTGMGFERLCMVLQGKKSSYDSDVFSPIIAQIEALTGATYEATNEQKDIAIRVISDHIRAITFCINDGQLPSNTGAGYVIRRILRRAVRYAFSYLGRKEATLYLLVPVLVEQFKELFPEIVDNQTFIQKVIQQEENSFLRTLESGLKRFSTIEQQLANNTQTEINGQAAFELYDTYGFPIDLTRLIAQEKGLTIDEAGFRAAMQEQKDRAREAAKVDTGDWNILQDAIDCKFVGYEQLSVKSQVLRWREVKQKKKTFYQIVLDETPFYAESGGQVGDVGFLQFGEERVSVTDTKKENNLIIHFVKKLPADITLPCTATVNAGKRQLTANNHTATHLLHAALRNHLGEHVQQKGSLVNSDYLRFDFSHFSKLTDDELSGIEREINAKIRENIVLEDLRNVPIEEAKEMGAMALFGEKYGDFVRVVVFDRGYSVELCGGTHVQATGELGFCKITTETSVAAGVRRVEAVTGKAAYDLINSELTTLTAIKRLFKNPPKLVQVVEGALSENETLKKEIESMHMAQAGVIKNDLKGRAEDINGVQFIAEKVKVKNTDMVKKIAYDLRKEVDNLFLVLGADINGKAHLTLMFDDQLTAEKSLNAGKMIRDLAKHIQGGGGGQPFYASAGGRKPEGIEKAIDESRKIVEAL